jgi:acetyl-CoA synthetase
VQESAVIGTPDNKGEEVKPFEVLIEGIDPSEKLIHELQNHEKHTTAPYKYPRSIEFMNELPKTIGGKIMRKKLREMELKKLQSE